jgi:signal transduction histidine kinase
VKLRSKLLALSLLTLLLPWSAWKLLQELERFLRDNQESTLLATAQTLSGALPLEFQSQLLFVPEHALHMRSLAQAPVLDGYSDDWPEPGHGLELGSDDGELNVRVLAAGSGGLIHLFVEVVDPTPVRASPGTVASEADAVRLSLRTARGMQSWNIMPAAPGPLRIRAHGSGSTELEGFWLDKTDDPALGIVGGYSLEVSLPVVVQAFEPGLELAVEVVDVHTPQGTDTRRAGAQVNGESIQWISLVSQWRDLSAWLSSAAPAHSRALLVDGQGWVLADSGGNPGTAGQTTWLQRLLYRLVSNERPTIKEPWTDSPVRLTDEAVSAALQGTPRGEWAQELENAVVRNTVAVPVRIEERVLGAMVLQSRSDGLLLITNRALGQLLLTTLALMLGLTVGLWYFASRLSRRVERLSGAVSQAMDNGVPASELPLTGDQDELGELARNNALLLRAVADYTQYLQTLAGKLSHELKTPLAITRSSLDNLASLPLDDEAQRFVGRAREGLDRQGEIVRAMSEANRLEQAIKVAEWESVDIRDLISSMADGYRAVHSGRSIRTNLPDEPVHLRCAPDLLAQALDKLVDNAITLSGEQDSVTITVERDTDEIRLCVGNTGSRLPDSLQERLFDSLVSVRTHRGETPHLGLGLYIVRLVAEAHGGKATAHNLNPDVEAAAPSQGVEFIIALPTAA